METPFEECVFTEVQLNNSDKLLTGLIYRSDSGTSENNENLIKLLEEVSNSGYTHTLLMGDFNYPNINWDSMHVPNENSTEMAFIECLQDNFLLQHVDRPTRWRGTDTPHTLDLVITNDDNVTNMEYHSPLGKSDHCVVNFKYHCYAVLKDETIEKKNSTTEQTMMKLEKP